MEVSQKSAFNLAPPLIRQFPNTSHASFFQSNDNWQLGRVLAVLNCYNFIGLVLIYQIFQPQLLAEERTQPTGCVRCAEKLLESLFCPPPLKKYTLN